jgi:hypothetical protein
VRTTASGSRRRRIRITAGRVKRQAEVEADDGGQHGVQRAAGRRSR